MRSTPDAVPWPANGESGGFARRTASCRLWPLPIQKFVLALNTYGRHGSMGRVGPCGDNAAMESFFSLLQKNVLNRKRWETRAELRLAITT